jgi:hypothetical protein
LCACGTGEGGPAHTTLAGEFQEAQMPLRVQLLAFPLERRHAFVRRLAAQVLARTPTLGAKHFTLQLRRQAMSLTRKGFDAAVVKQQVDALAIAVLAEI